MRQINDIPVNTPEFQKALKINEIIRYLGELSEHRFAEFTMTSPNGSEWKITIDNNGNFIKTML